MSQTNTNNPDAYNPPDATNSTNVNNPGVSNPEMQTSQIGRDKDDINTGAYYPPVQSDQTPPRNVDVDEGKYNPPVQSSSTPTNADINTGASNPNLQPYQTGQTGPDQPRQSTQPRIEQDVLTTSSRGYDPIKGPVPEEHGVSVNDIRLRQMRQRRHTIRSNVLRRRCNVRVMTRSLAIPMNPV